jgi:hypothetical protein
VIAANVEIGRSMGVPGALAASACVIGTIGAYYEAVYGLDLFSILESTATLLLAFTASTIVVARRLQTKGVRRTSSRLVVTLLIAPIGISIVSASLYAKTTRLHSMDDNVTIITNHVVGHVVDEILDDISVEKALFTVTISHPVVYDPFVAAFLFGETTKREQMLTRFSTYRFYPADKVVSYFESMIRSIKANHARFINQEKNIADLLDTYPELVEKIKSDSTRRIGPIVTRDTALFYWKMQYYEKYFSGDTNAPDIESYLESQVRP